MTLASTKVAINNSSACLVGSDRLCSPPPPDPPPLLQCSLQYSDEMSSSGTSSSTSLSPSSSSVSLQALAGQPPIDLARATPTPWLLPAASLAYAARSVLTDPFGYADALQYGPSLGSAHLRAEIADWLRKHYRPSSDPDSLPPTPLSTSTSTSNGGYLDVTGNHRSWAPTRWGGIVGGGGGGGGEEAEVDRLCITGGASQNLASVLARFTEPVYTRAVWIVAPCATRRRRTFEDAGLGARVHVVGEGVRGEGVDLLALERGMAEVDAAMEEYTRVPVRLKAPFRSGALSSSFGSISRGPTPRIRKYSDSTGGRDGCHDPRPRTAPARGAMTIRIFSNSGSTCMALQDSGQYCWLPILHVPPQTRANADRATGV